MNIIQNTIVLKTGDTIIINESVNTPYTQKVINRIQNADRIAAFHTDDGDTIIPVDNILYATASVVNTDGVHRKV